MKILELFCGYGTASFALKQLGIPYDCVGYSDIDKYANQCFRQNHEGKELGDATKINPDELEDFDLLTGGFPCQAFSVAGKGLGELDTRGTLFWEIIRIAEVKQPRWMLLENVKGLTNKKHRPTFEKILSELERIGYFVHWKILNTKDYGIPQNRERVWFVCFRRFTDYANFEWPEPEPLKIFLKDILEEEVDEKYYLSQASIDRLINKNQGYHSKVNPKIGSTLFASQHKISRGMDLIEPTAYDAYNKRLKYEGVIPTLTEPHHNNLRIIQINQPKHSNNRVYSDEGISPTLRDMSQGGNRQPSTAASRGRNPSNPSDRTTGLPTEQRLEPRDDGCTNTISTVQKDNYVIDNYNHRFREDNCIGSLGSNCGCSTATGSFSVIDGLTIRKLTPKECFRLQGFLNDEVNLEGLSNTQQYKLAGNGQSVNVVKKIFEKMFQL